MHAIWKNNWRRERWFNPHFPVWPPPGAGKPRDAWAQEADSWWITFSWTLGATWPEHCGQGRVTVVAAGWVLGLVRMVTAPEDPTPPQSHSMPHKTVGSQRLGAPASKAGRARQWTRAWSPNLEVSGVGNGLKQPLQLHGASAFAHLTLKEASLGKETVTSILQKRKQKPQVACTSSHSSGTQHSRLDWPWHALSHLLHLRFPNPSWCMHFRKMYIWHLPSQLWRVGGTASLPSTTSGAFLGDWMLN